tara:strand:+ start:48279 stop:50759 length:2481 start_codon:yes stop_codon:yes gene_type:complete
MIIKKSRFNYFNFSSLLVVVLVLFGVLFGVNVMADLDFGTSTNVTVGNGATSPWVNPFSNSTTYGHFMINVTVASATGGEQNISHINITFDDTNFTLVGFVGRAGADEMGVTGGTSGYPNSTDPLTNVTFYVGDGGGADTGTEATTWGCHNVSTGNDMSLICNTSEAIDGGTLATDVLCGAGSAAGCNVSLIIGFNVTNTSVQMEGVNVLNITTGNDSALSLALLNVQGANFTAIPIQVDTLPPRISLVNVSDGNTTLFGNSTISTNEHSLNETFYLDSGSNWTIEVTVEDKALRDVYLLFKGSDAGLGASTGDGTENVTYDASGDHNFTELITMTAMTTTGTDNNETVWRAVLSGDSPTNGNISSFIFVVNDTFNNIFVYNDSEGTHSSYVGPFMVSTNATLLRTAKVNITDSQTGTVNTVDNPTTSSYVSASNSTIDIEVLGDLRSINGTLFYNTTGALSLLPNGVDVGTALTVKLGVENQSNLTQNAANIVVYKVAGGFDFTGNDSNTVRFAFIANQSTNSTGHNPINGAVGQSHVYTTIREFAVTVDGSQPNPILTAPTDTTVSVRASIKYTCTGTDILSGVSTYVTKLTKPGGTSVSKSATAAGVEQTFKDSDTNEPGIYTVKCTLTDNVGNTNSVTKEFSALYASGGGATNGGGGGGSVREVSFDIDFSQDNVVESTVLVAEGSSRTFTFDGATTHTLKVDDVEGNLVTITISSDPQTLTLNVGESKEVDLNEDGINDVEVTLNSVDNGVADIAIKKIEEGAKIVAEEDRQAAELVSEVTEPTETVTGTPSEGGTTGTVVTIIIIVVVILLLLWWFMRKK